MPDEMRTTGEHSARNPGRRSSDREPAGDVAQRVVQTLKDEVASDNAPLFGPTVDRAFRKFARLGGMWVLVASLIGWVGGRIVSPGEEQAATRAAMGEGFKRQDSLRTALASEIHVRDSVQSAQLIDLQRQVLDDNASHRLNTYVLCILARRLDATIAPPECGGVISNFRPR